MQKTKIEEEKLAVQPPEPDYIASKFVLKVPVTDQHFKSRWELRKYAAAALEKELGDEIQLTSLTVRKPSLADRLIARLLKRPPNARLHATIEF